MHPWLKNLLNSFEKKSITKPPRNFFHIPPAVKGIPLWNSSRFDELAEESYCKNVIVYRAVTLIARNLASVPWRLQKGKNLLDAHPLLDLINSPNPSQTGVSFLETLASYLLLSGNSYVELVNICNHQWQLYLLRPDRVQIIPDVDGHSYVYSVGEKRRMIKKSSQSSLEPLLHLKLFHPLNDWYGMSPVEAAASSIDHHNEVGKHNLAILQNGGRPSGALILDADDISRLSEEDHQALRTQIRETFQGADNAGRVVVLEGKMKWQELSISPKDMDFIESKYLAAREIAQAYGVPAMLVGVPGDATFANYKEARLHLWEDTILPLLDKIISEVNQWLCPLYDNTMKFTYDLEGIPALIMRREALWARLESCSFLTDNEKREALGYSRQEG
jgi:HK97 family phage portal protein